MRNVQFVYPCTIADRRINDMYYMGICSARLWDIIDAISDITCGIDDETLLAMKVTF